jgi:hypothetical protein
MALATLCNQIRSFRPPRITAFIVDHRLRPGSTQEAHFVGKVLAGLGIQHKILTANWNGIADPQILNQQLAGCVSRPSAVPVPMQTLTPFFWLIMQTIKQRPY